MAKANQIVVAVNEQESSISFEIIAFGQPVTLSSEKELDNLLKALRDAKRQAEAIREKQFLAKNLTLPL